MTNFKNLCYNTQTLQNQTKGLKMTTTVVQFRVDENLKKQADELFADLGLDTGTAMRMFLKQALKIGGLPFKVLREKQDSYSLDEAPSIKAIRAKMSKMPKEELEALEAEVIAEMFGDSNV